MQGQERVLDVAASHHGLRLKSADKVSERNVTVMTVFPSYLNVHPPADPPRHLLPCPPPPAHIHLLVSGSEEITISVIMARMKLLKLITGHNTSFSALIRKLIGNRLVCFSPLDFFPPLYTVGLLRQREKAIFQHADEGNLPPNLLFDLFI